MKKVSDIAKVKRELREARSQLKSLADQCGGFLLYMDSVMQGPSTVERGRAISLACNKLDMAKQIAERYGLGLAARRS
jgi:hypothetical protein